MLLFMLAGPAPAAVAATTPITHVILFMEENHNWKAVTAQSMPFLWSMGQSGAVSHDAAAGHPSLPNYIAVTSGDRQGITTDCKPATCMVSADNIFNQVGDWAVWAQSMPKNCDRYNVSPYAVRHTAAPYYSDLTGSCPNNDIPYPDTLPTTPAAFTFAIPDLNNDAHNGSLSQADAYLQQQVTQIEAQPWYLDGSTLIEVTFDEGGCSPSPCNNTVYTAYANPQIAPGTFIKTGTSHYSLLRLNEELLGVPLLAGAQTANDIRAALGL
jgi:hypothetical protein